MNIPPNTDIDVCENTRFVLNERVTRPEDVFEKDSPIMEGTVKRVYMRRAYYPISGVDYFYPELYEVHWDSGRIGRGYLPYGIDKANQ